MKRHLDGILGKQVMAGSRSGSCPRIEMVAAPLLPLFPLDSYPLIPKRSLFSIDLFCTPTQRKARAGGRLKPSPAFFPIVFL